MLFRTYIPKNENHVVKVAGICNIMSEQEFDSSHHNFIDADGEVLLKKDLAFPAEIGGSLPREAATSGLDALRKYYASIPKNDWTDNIKGGVNVMVPFKKDIIPVSFGFARCSLALNKKPHTDTEVWFERV